MPLTDVEFAAIKAIPPEDRRKTLLGLVSYYEDILEAKENVESPSLWKHSFRKAKRPRSKIGKGTRSSP